MLTIRRKQMAAFEAQSPDQLLRAIAAWLRARDPAALVSLNDQILQRRVEWGIGRARQWGMETDCSIAVFISLLFRIGPQFDRHPAIARYLQDSSRTPDERLAHLVQTFERWSAVQADVAPAAWEVALP